jgi:hypothetical protein
MRPTDKTRNQDLARSQRDHFNSVCVAGVKPIELARDLALAEQGQDVETLNCRG